MGLCSILQFQLRHQRLLKPSLLPDWLSLLFKVRLWDRDFSFFRCSRGVLVGIFHKLFLLTSLKGREVAQGIKNKIRK